jgi:hypothetical protein
MDPRSLHCDLAGMEADLACRAPPAWPSRSALRECRGLQAASASASIIAPSVSMPVTGRPIEGRRLRPTPYPQAFGIAFVFMVDVFMALLSFVESAPEPTGSRRATPLLLVQHRPGHSLKTWLLHVPDQIPCGRIESIGKVRDELRLRNSRFGARSYQEYHLIPPSCTR